MKKKIVPALTLAFTLGFILLGSTITARASSSEWTLKIDGAVSNPTVLTLSELMAQPKTTVYGEIYCYGAFVGGGDWTGVSLSILLDKVKPDESAMSLGFHAADGYNKEISITEAMGGDVILAYEINGQPLSETLRLVLPSANGDLWVSMVNQITVNENPAGTTITSTGTEFPQPLQPSPVPQQPPTPQPTSNPQPSQTPQPQQTQQPSQAPLSTPSPTANSSEPDPAIWIVGTASATIIVTSLAISFKKRLRPREENALSYNDG